MDSHQTDLQMPFDTLMDIAVHQTGEHNLNTLCNCHRCRSNYG